MLREMSLDEKKVLARIRKLVATQKDLNRIEKMKDKSAAAKQAVAYLGDLFLRERIFEVLGHCGRGSLPTLLQMLADPKKIEFHANAVRVLAIIDGKDVDEKLTELLKKEIALWQKLGPTLKRGWPANLGAERLDDVVVDAGADRLHDIFLGVLAGGHDEGRLFHERVGADVFEEIEPVHAVHVPVGDDEIELAALHGAQGLFSALCLDHLLNADLLEREAGELAHALLVIDQKHLQVLR